MTSDDPNQPPVSRRKDAERLADEKIARGMLARNLKRRRETLGVSQKEIAIDLKVTSGTVSKWENPQSTTKPTYAQLKFLRDRLEISIDALLGLEDVGREPELDLTDLERRMVLSARRLPARDRLLLETLLGAMLRGTP